MTLGWSVRPSAFFDTITVEVGERREAILARAVESGINLRDIPSCHGTACIGISCDETTTMEVVQRVWCVFGDPPAKAAKRAGEPAGDAIDIPAGLRRDSKFLTHQVFHQYRSETELLRYMRRLADCDLALDRCMIPLGSCTMKLNATAEMIPLTWPEFADLHPFAPASQAKGYAAMIAELDTILRRITGYDAISFQPNSGAQGEYAGLLAIRAYHRSRGEAHRTVCLIPASAHGTNPASAHMAGMDVVVVGCDGSGNIDLADLRAKADAHGNRLAAIMITYPSTHGVFEQEVRAICDIVHAHGGQVYLDGANLNAQVGVGPPRRLRRRRQPRQSAQDILHSPRRRWPRHGSDRRQGSSGAVPAGASGASGSADRDRSGIRGAIRVGVDPAHLLDVLSADGRKGPDRGHQGRHSQCELHCHAAGGALSAALQGALRPRRARMHHRYQAAQDHRGGERRRCRQAPHRLWVSRADNEFPSRGNVDDRADRIGVPDRRSTGSATP